MDYCNPASALGLWKRFLGIGYSNHTANSYVSAYSTPQKTAPCPEKPPFLRSAAAFSRLSAGGLSPRQGCKVVHFVSGNASQSTAPQRRPGTPPQKSAAAALPSLMLTAKLPLLLFLPAILLFALPPLFASGTASAQQAPAPAPDRFSMETSIRISGNVIARTGGENILFDTIYEVHFEQLRAGQTLITVDPITDFATADAGAGYVVAKGAPNAQFQLTFSRQVVLRHATERDNVLIVNYLLSANSTAEQENSAYVLEAAPTFRLNTDGEFHFWVGGQVDISNAIRGEYEGEFTLEVEYL